MVDISQLYRGAARSEYANWDLFDALQAIRVVERRGNVLSNKTLE